MGVSLTGLGIIPLAALRLAPAVFTRLLPLALLTVALGIVALTARKLPAVLGLPCAARNRSLRQSARGCAAGSISAVLAVGIVLFFLRRLRDPLHLAENLHEFLAGDGLLLDQELRDLIHSVPVFSQQALGLLVGLLQDPHHLLINLARRGLAAVEHVAAGQVLVLPGLQAHEAELLGHAVLGDHRPGQVGGLLDIVGRACGHAVEYQLLGGTPRKSLHQHGFQLFLGIQILFFLGHVHHVTQSAHGPGHDGDLLHRLRVLLQGADQRVAHLVVGDDAPLLLVHDPVLLLLTH